MQLEKVIHLLATHTRDPAEKQFDPRVSLAHVRIRSAFNEWIAAGHVPVFENRGGDLCLKNPRAVIELLRCSPTHRDLLPPTLKSFLDQTVSASAAESAALSAFTSSSMTFNITIAAPAAVVPPPRTEAPPKLQKTELEKAIDQCVQEYWATTQTRTQGGCVSYVQSKHPEASRKMIREAFERKSHQAGVGVKQGPKGPRKA
jgi:hypothetical protein